MKKLFITKTDNASTVVEKIINDTEDEIVLMIPKSTPFGSAEENFGLVKREADAAGKKLVVESVDERVLAFARSANIDATHPFFGGEKGASASSLSDIVSKDDREPAKPAATAKRRTTKKAAKEEPTASVRIPVTVIPSAEEEEPEMEEIAPTIDAGAMRPQMSPPQTSPKVSPMQFRHEEEPTEVEVSWMGRHWKKLVIAGVVLVAVIFGVVTVVDAVWSHATMTINFKKVPWSYTHSFTADTTVSKLDATNDIVPAEVFTANKNLTKLYPATGKKDVSVKATGVVTIYNAYSSSPQTLVATTRFQTPDGKIFRIVNSVIVPGAQISSGKITAASIDAPVVADQPGPNYNVPATPRLSIPGFKGSPKYDAFYGELKAATSGGFVGNKAFPTDADIQTAKNNMTSIIQTTLQSNALTIYPPDFKVLDGASNFNVTKMTVNTDTDASGNFSVFGEATISAIGFREADVKSVLTSLAGAANPGDVFGKLDLTYSQVQADFKKNVVTFSLAAQGVLTPSFSPSDFTTKVLGQSVDSARSTIAGLQGLSDARVSLWPIWLSKIPNDAKRVKIVTN